MLKFVKHWLLNRSLHTKFEKFQSKISTVRMFSTNTTTTRPHTPTTHTNDRDKIHLNIINYLNLMSLVFDQSKNRTKE